MARIDRNLNFVFPVETDTGIVWVHSMPISRDVFEKYYRVIAKTFARLWAEGRTYVFMSGPKIAANELRDTAMQEGIWDTPDGVERGLLAEIRRLTNVGFIGKNGAWENAPLQSPEAEKLLGPDDLREVENLIVFFTCNSAMMSAAMLSDLRDGTLLLLGVQSTSLSCTAYCASLPTLTATASSGETAPTS